MNPAHLDYDVLADLAEGLLEDDQAASVNAHLDTCADCRDLSADLADVSRILAEAPIPSMPADLASRIDSALAAESMHSATVVSLAERRGRRHWRVLSAAAATVVVLGGGAVVGKAALDGASNEHASATKPAMDPGDQGRSAERGDAPKNGAQSQGAMAGPAVPVNQSGTDYRSATLGSQVAGVLGQKYKTRTQAAPPDTRLNECVTKVAKGEQPVLVDSAKFEGSAATVIALPGPDSKTWDIVVVGPDCSVKHTATGG